MLIGYARVSTEEQELARQLDALHNVGCELIFEEKVTGTRRDRPELEKLLNSLRKDDTVIVLEISRLSRSTKHLLEIVEHIKARGAYLKSINDTWLDTTSDNPMSDFLLTVMGALSQLERELIVKRVKEGMKSAKKRGIKVGRPELDTQTVKDALKLYDDGNMSVKDIIRITGISQGKLYKEINKRKSQSQK